MLLCAIDQVDCLKEKLNGKTIALAANSASVDAEGRSSVVVLKDICNIHCLLSFEHGFSMKAGAGENVSEECLIDGIKVISLYSDEGSVSIPADVKEAVDCIVYDIQDLGLRFYTYISSLLSLMRECAVCRIPLFILDRMNPLGRKIRGNILCKDSLSFVGPASIPIRYGMTPLELALWYRDEFNIEAEIDGIKILGWRGELQIDTSRRFYPTSPSVKDFETAFIYSGTCLIEGTNLSEGRGTSSPFRIIGAPWLDAEKVKHELSCLKSVEGFCIDTVSAVPSCSKWKSEICSCLRISVDDYSVADPLSLTLSLIYLCFKDSADIQLARTKDSCLFIDRLLGKNLIEQIIAGHDIEPLFKRDEEMFLEQSSRYYLY